MYKALLNREGLLNQMEILIKGIHNTLKLLDWEQYYTSSFKGSESIEIF